MVGGGGGVVTFIGRGRELRTTALTFMGGGGGGTANAEKEEIREKKLRYANLQLLIGLLKDRKQ